MDNIKMSLSCSLIDKVLVEQRIGESDMYQLSFISFNNPEGKQISYITDRKRRIEKLSYEINLALCKYNINLSNAKSIYNDYIIIYNDGMYDSLNHAALLSEYMKDEIANGRKQNT